MDQKEATEEQKKESARKTSIKEGAFSSLMEGFGNRYMTPFALSVGATNNHIALLSSLPSLLCNISQISSLRLLKKHSRKKIVVIGVLFQALTWLPLIAVGALYFYFNLSSHIASLLVIAFYTLMVLVGAIASPAWSSWMKDILSKNDGEYLSRRNKLVTGIVLLGTLTAGAILNYFQDKQVFFGFAIIFFVAFVGRTTAVYLFTKKYEPTFVYDEKSYFSLWQFVKHMVKNNFGKFVVFISLASFATSIAGPFFAVYLLKEMDVSYLTYTLITISPIAATFAFLPTWGKFSDKYGNVKLLKITGALIPFIPLLWVFTPYILAIGHTKAVFYLFAVEIFSGFAWAGFNHGASTFIYEAVTREKIAYCTTYFNIFNSMGIFLGAMLGGFIASHNFTTLTSSTLITVFIVSAIARGAIIIIMAPIIKEIKPVEPFSLTKSIERKITKEKTFITEQFWHLMGYIPIRLRA